MLDSSKFLFVGVRLCYYRRPTRKAVCFLGATRVLRKRRLSALSTYNYNPPRFAFTLPQAKLTALSLPSPAMGVFMTMSFRMVTRGEERAWVL